MMAHTPALFCLTAAVAAGNNPAAAAVDLHDLAAPAAGVYDAGSRAQLFVDRLLVREAEGVCFTQHPGTKHPQNPLLKADQPWEGWRLEIFGNVLYDEEERLFKMWYLAEPAGAGATSTTRMSPATRSAKTASTGRNRASAPCPPRTASRTTPWPTFTRPA